MPLIPRYMVIGSTSLGVAGAIFGLVVGLGYPSTAWFALFEGGVLAGAAGAVLGLVAGVVAYLSMAVARLIKD
jgi:uncharacterized membrane protein YedE/YeeE